MKSVHTADMVAHLWANRSQDTARTAGQNFWFTGARLYSYGNHFVVAAHLENGRILWNQATYSNTTSKHQHCAAWALTEVQRQGRIYVPAMRGEDVRNLETVRQTGKGRVIPKLAQACVDGIVDAVQSMANMRIGAGPMRAAFSRAKDLQESGDALLAYVAHGKRIPTWPIARLPESLPEDKAGLQAFIQSIAKGRLIQQHDKAIADARERLQEIEGAIQAGTDDGWRIGNVTGAIDGINRMMNDAQKWHETAHGRKSAKVRAVLQDLAKIEPAARALVAEWQAVQARREIRMTSRDVYRMLRQRGTRSPAVRSGYRGRRDTGYYFGRMRQALASLPESEAAQHSGLVARLARCEAWDVSMNGMESARDSMATGESYLPGHPGDALRQFAQAANYATAALQHHAEFAALHGPECRGIANTAHEKAESLRAEIAAKHARAVDDWKAGAIRSLSYAAGTYARINGRNVETSRGATVPIEHACRLARIARRVIAAGGKAWPDGSGPMVGSFRVQSIGADGRAVIGCHEFEPAESLRMLALLESCADCARVTADVE